MIFVVEIDAGAPDAILIGTFPNYDAANAWVLSSIFHGRNITIRGVIDSQRSDHVRKGF